MVVQCSKVPGNILEVGVWRGGTGALIAKKAALCGIESPVFLCDTFSGVAKAGGQDSCYKGGEHADATRLATESLVRDRLKLSNVTILEGVFPEETAHLIDRGAATFRFCHIDVDAYQSVVEQADVARNVGAQILLADEIASRAPLAVRAAKRMIVHSYESFLNDGLAEEKHVFYNLFGTQDQKEGMQAFIEKRKPEWRGK